MHRQPQKFTKNFRLLRKLGRVQEFVSIYLNQAQRSIFIASDGGRLVRPLLVCNNGKIKLTQQHIDDVAKGLRDFSDLLREGVVEYLDVNEENNAFIALNEKVVSQQTSHMEIDPFTILGCVAGLIPYPHHN